MNLTEIPSKIFGMAGKKPAPNRPSDDFDTGAPANLNPSPAVETAKPAATPAAPAAPATPAPAVAPAKQTPAEKLAQRKRDLAAERERKRLWHAAQQIAPTLFIDADARLAKPGPRKPTQPQPPRNFAVAALAGDPLIVNLTARLNATRAAFLDELQRWAPVLDPSARRSQLLKQIGEATSPEHVAALRDELSALSDPKALRASEAAASAQIAKVREPFEEAAAKLIAAAEALLKRLLAAVESEEAKFFAAYGLPRQATAVSRTVASELATVTGFESALKPTPEQSLRFRGSGFLSGVVEFFACARGTC